MPGLTAGADDSYIPIGDPLSKTRTSLPEQLLLLIDLGRWIPIAALVGILAGSASALLLVSLNYATAMRERHVWLILLLAPAGWLMAQMYKRFGASVEAGNNLVLEQTHSPTAVIPFRMTPLILIGTFITHLFGGSAGREGTAIQTGASLADQMSRPLGLTPHQRRILLMAGISAGFASVFGTPLAGAVFGLEVLAIGTLSYDAIAPCFMAAFAGDLVTRAWHVQHTVYHVSETPAMSIAGVGYAMIAGAVFGLAGMGFARLTHAVSRAAKKHIGNAALRPVAGGLIITVAVFAVGTAHTLKYLGLGIPTIVASFQGKLPVYDFAVKSLFTAVTLGTGFKGGEVTPLFFIGSTLGNALSHIIPLPTSLLAAMGFVAVFAGAANTPIASTLMAIELFGAEAGAYAGIACVLSYLFSGHTGIYHAQRVGKSKHLSRAADEGLTLGDLAKLHEELDEALALEDKAPAEKTKPIHRG
jgi:H+/Cl- antiporter ClcA